MEGISDILATKKIPEIKKNARPANVKYELCKVIADYTGLQVFFVMRLLKIHGMSKLERLKNFLKDYPNLDKKRAPGLAIWYLKQK